MTTEVLPKDEFNQSLVDLVHPADWQNPTPDGPYHLVVIGAGTAGLVTAAGAAGLGAKVALIERHLMGGDCLNTGCVPSKALIRSGRTVAAIRDAQEQGIGIGDPDVNFAEVMQRLRRLRAGIAPNDSAPRFRDLGVDVYLGEAAFVNDTTVQVGDTILNFGKAVIATGGRAAAPPIPGLEDVAYLTNETLFSLTELPKRFGIIGGGPIGSEMAQTFARLGSEVHLIEKADRVLSREDAEASALVEASMRKDGVNLHHEVTDLKVENTSGGIRLLMGDGRDAVEVDQLLVAVGRAPNVEGLHLEAVGVEYDRNGITVNDNLRTTHKRIFACGDVCTRFKFTHAADFMARTVIRNALFMGRAKMSDLVIPWSTYTSPEVAQVGLTEHAAKEQSIPVDVFKMPLDDVDRAILDGETNGFVKVLTQKGTGKIVGATIVAAHAGDLISELTLAMTQGISLGSIANTIHPYPTQADAIRRLGDLYNRTRFTPKIQKLFKTWLNFTRPK